MPIKRYPKVKNLPVFSQKMAEYRDKADMNFNDLERATGITNQGLINIERYGADPALSTALAIADALGVRIQDMVGR